MERTFLETVHFLGLDMEIAVVAVMAAAQAMRGLAGQSWARLKDSRPTVRTAVPSVTAVWPPSGWRSSH